MKCEQLFYSTAEVFAGGVAEPHPTQWNLPEGGGFHPSPSGKNRRLTGTLVVCVGTPEAHVRLPLGHRDSTQNEVHTEAGPNIVVVVTSDFLNICFYAQAIG